MRDGPLAATEAAPDAQALQPLIDELARDPGSHDLAAIATEASGACTAHELPEALDRGLHRDHARRRRAQRVEEHLARAEALVAGSAAPAAGLEAAGGKFGLLWVAGTALLALLHTLTFGPQASRFHALASLVLAAATAASVSLILGPLVLAPVVVLAMAVTILVHSRARRRARCLIGVACPAALFLPLLAPPPGLTEAWFRFEDGAMILLPDAVSLNPGATLVLLLGAWLLSPFVSASLVARAVDARTGLERQRAAQLLVLWSLLPASG